MGQFTSSPWYEQAAWWAQHRACTLRWCALFRAYYFHHKSGINVVLLSLLIISICLVQLFPEQTALKSIVMIFAKTANCKDRLNLSCRKLVRAIHFITFLLQLAATDTNNDEMTINQVSAPFSFFSPGADCCDWLIESTLFFCMTWCVAWWCAFFTMIDDSMFSVSIVSIVFKSRQMSKMPMSFDVYYSICTWNPELMLICNTHKDEAHSNQIGSVGNGGNGWNFKRICLPP